MGFSENFLLYNLCFKYFSHTEGLENEIKDLFLIQHEICQPSSIQNNFFQREIEPEFLKQQVNRFP